MDNMEPEDDKELWDVLGRLPEPTLSPFFARDVLRKVRQGRARFDRVRSWFSVRKLVGAVAVFALCCAAAQAQPQQHRGPIGRPPPLMGAPHGPAPMPAPHGAPSSQLHGPPPGQQPSAQSIRERWLAMPPDARQNFRRNAELW